MPQGAIELKLQSAGPAPSPSSGPMRPFELVCASSLASKRLGSAGRLEGFSKGSAAPRGSGGTLIER